jgi:hypothetical protein
MIRPVAEVGIAQPAGPRREGTEMRTRFALTTASIAVLLVIATAWCALAQPAPGGMPMGAPGAFGGGFQGMMMASGWPPAPTPVVVAADGIVYLACDGVLTAYDGKTLKVLAEVVYWERAEQAQ